MTRAKDEMRPRTGRVVQICAAVAGALAVLWIVLSVSLAGAFRSARPSTALAWAPWDAGARAAQASRIMALLKTDDAQNRAAALAVDAIGRDPTQVAAVRTLALVSDNDRARASRLMNQAQRLSRRDLLTQVWFIQSSLSRPQVALGHFDIALRTSTRNRSTVLPLLVAATSDPAMVPPLRNLLVQRPEWWLEFAHYLAAGGQNPRHVVALTQGLLDPEVPPQRLILDALLGRLVGLNAFDLAWRVYADAHRRRPLLSQEPVREGGFEALSGFPPFAWALLQEPDLWAAAQPRPGSAAGVALRLAAFNGRSGDVARQLIRLTPGRYRFEAEAGDVAPNPFDRPSFRVSCARPTPPAVLLDARPPRGGSPPQRVTGAFAVPAGCDWQWLTVHLAGQGADPDSGPWIDNLTVVRAP